METNSKKVLEALPDFDDYMRLAEEIKKIAIERMLTENQIKSREADVFKEVMTNSVYFVNNKAVPVSHYENAYKFSGLANELLPLREKLAELVAELELKRSTFEVYSKMHDLYKTLVYQEKNMT